MMAFATNLPFGGARIDQPNGIGVGYFAAAASPGLDALILVENDSPESVMQVVVTSYDGPVYSFRVTSGSVYSENVGNIQTIGVLSVGAPSGACFGTIALLPFIS